MASIDPAQELSDAAIGRYWTRVMEVMTEIFGMPRAKALRRVGALRAMQLDDRSAANYHIDPLRVAADLAGKTVSGTHIQQYLKSSGASARPPASPERSGGSRAQATILQPKSSRATLAKGRYRNS